MHGHGDKPFLCTHEGCERGVAGNGFPRHWNLRDHMKRVHSDPGVSRDSSSSPNYQPFSTNKGKKRKADNSPLSWEKPYEECRAKPSIGEKESSLADRYREQHQKLSNIVPKLHDPIHLPGLRAVVTSSQARLILRLSPPTMHNR